jgi:undecaprenyl-diphosphatase
VAKRREHVYEAVHVPELGDWMNMDQGLFVPLILGIVEGLTEFLPVSSTAHILLLGHFLGFESPGKVFEVLIQLGAILAIVASAPAAIAGVLLHDFIKGVIYETPVLICAMLIIGGIILLYVDQLRFQPKYTDIYEYPWHLCFLIGLFQMLALVPGVSRSGASIVGALLLGTDKRSAAEFTFFIAIPIMTGAFGYDLYKNWDIVTSDFGLSVGVGFGAAFIVAILVVRGLLGFVQRHGFAPFAYWRIFVGAIGLWGVLLFSGN